MIIIEKRDIITRTSKIISSFELIDGIIEIINDLDRGNDVPYVYIMDKIQSFGYSITEKDNTDIIIEKLLNMAMEIYSDYFNQQISNFETLIARFYDRPLENIDIIDHLYKTDRIFTGFTMLLQEASYINICDMLISAKGHNKTNLFEEKEITQIKNNIEMIEYLVKALELQEIENNSIQELVIEKRTNN